MKKPKKKVVKVRSYTIIHTHYEDGSYSERRTCDGFQALELLGLVTKIQLEVLHQIQGIMKPPTVSKRIIKK